MFLYTQGLVSNKSNSQRALIKKMYGIDIEEQEEQQNEKPNYQESPVRLKFSHFQTSIRNWNCIDICIDYSSYTVWRKLYPLLGAYISLTSYLI